MTIKACRKDKMTAASALDHTSEMHTVHIVHAQRLIAPNAGST